MKVAAEAGDQVLHRLGALRAGEGAEGGGLELDAAAVLVEPDVLQSAHGPVVLEVVDGRRLVAQTSAGRVVRHRDRHALPGPLPSGEKIDELKAAQEPGL